MNRIVVWDNGGETADRYTVQIGRDIYTMSDNPLSPQGVNMYDTTLAKNEKLCTGLDTKVRVKDLPKEVQRAIKARMQN
jgi:hypothetical protein